MQRKLWIVVLVILIAFFLVRQLRVVLHRTDGIVSYHGTHEEELQNTFSSVTAADANGDNNASNTGSDDDNTAYTGTDDTKAARTGGDNSNTDLMQLYVTRYKEMKVTADNVANGTCPEKPGRHDNPCHVQGCNVTFPPLQERLKRVLQTQHPITQEQKSLISSFVQYGKKVDVDFVTAASSNHFGESQGLVRDLHQKVFPELRRQGRFSFHFYYYDLGLTPDQVQKLKTHCNCTVLSFPFSRLPTMFRKLGTCIWKPLIMKAHLSRSRFTLWMDTSVRFLSPSISTILEQTQRLGVLVAHSQFMLPKHVHPAMLSYFHLQPCLLAPFYEIAGGFIALHNDVLIHKAIVDPWVACAFSPKCICPSENGVNCVSFRGCKERNDAYFQCHRYDQSALGILLSLLFDWRVSELAHGLNKDTTPWFAFRRGNVVKHFP